MKLFLNDTNEENQSEQLQLNKAEPKHDDSIKIAINEAEIRNLYVSLTYLVCYASWILTECQAQVL